MRPLVARGLAALAAGSLLAAAPAGADTAIDASIFKPALDSNGIFSVERARGLKQWDFGLRLTTSYAQEPLKLDVPGIGDDSSADAVIDNSMVLDFGVAMGLTKRLTFALDAAISRQPLGPGYGVHGTYRPVDDPSEAQPGTGFFSARPEQNLSPSVTPVGDARVGLKYQLVDGKLGLAAQAVAYVPFGDEDVFAGSPGFTFEPKLIGELALGQRGVLAVNLGARVRDGALAYTYETDPAGYIMYTDGAPVEQPLLYVGTEALAAAAVKFNVVKSVGLGAEAFALIPIAKAEDAECSGDCKNGDLTADAIGGLFIQMTPDTLLTLGAGIGLLSSAARHDSFRLLGALAWSPTPEGARAVGRGDSDGDGIADGPDVCPEEPEDPDSFQDDDGCPELDNDLDGVLDAQDTCAAEPEDRDDYQDEDGCPDGDNDGDSVPDHADRCALEKEDTDGFQDDDGCPDEDNDGDGILDAKDQCPTQPETVNGYQDVDGCPDQAVQGGPKLTVDRIDLQGERVDFEGQSANLTKGARDTLEAVAQVIKSPEARDLSFRIEVGVEASGSKPKDKARDRRLSEQRAQVVINFLASKGVDPTRLFGAGLGSDRPIDVKNPRDPKLNRRVEFIRISQ